jgi:hypothetical protein
MTSVAVLTLAWVAGGTPPGCCGPLEACRRWSSRPLWASGPENRPTGAARSDDLDLGGITTAVDCEPRGAVLEVTETQ